MHEPLPNAELTLLAERRARQAAQYAAVADDERWPPLHCTLFITGSALACWGFLATLAVLVFG